MIAQLCKTYNEDTLKMCQYLVKKCKIDVAAKNVNSETALHFLAQEDLLSKAE